MITKLNKLIRDRRGAGMTEYIIVLTVIAIFAIGAFKLFGSKVSEKIGEQTTKLNDVGK